MSNLQTPKLKFLCDNRTIPVSEESHSPSAYIHTFKLVLLLTTSWNSINWDGQCDKNGISTACSAKTPEKHYTSWEKEKL